MPALNKTERIINRNKKIRKRFIELTETKRKRSDDALQQLEDEFMPLAQNTIWLIISQTGYYKTL